MRNLGPCFQRGWRRGFRIPGRCRQETAHLIDHRLKRRSDLVVVHPVLKMPADGALNWKKRSMAGMRRRTTWLRVASRNQDYAGGDLVFPEFGRRPYRARWAERWCSRAAPCTTSCPLRRAAAMRFWLTQPCVRRTTPSFTAICVLRARLRSSFFRIRCCRGAYADHGVRFRLRMYATIFSASRP